MALTSTLYTGLSGLSVNQTQLNVVGNNIANANTVGFKASRALFKPQFYITDSGGSSPGNDYGGANPSQRGLGAALGSIEKDFSPGTIEPTGKSTDMAIEGDGFFIVRGTAQRYTRDGSFTLNSSNQLVTTSGDFVQGYGIDDNYNIVPGQLQNISIPLGGLTAAQQTEHVRLEGNLNADGNIGTGASIFNSQTLTLVGGAAAPTDGDLLVNVADAATPATAMFSAGQTLTLTGKQGGRDLPAATLEITGATTVADFRAFLEQGLGIETGVPGPVTPGVTLSASGTTATLDITGNMGMDNALTLTGRSLIATGGGSPMQFTESPASDPSGESIQTSFIAYDSLGTPLTISVTAVLESKADTGNTWRFYASTPDNKSGGVSVGTGTLTFDNDGRLADSAGTTVSIDRSGTGARTPLNIKLDFDSMTSQASRGSDLVMTEQDGSDIGTLNGFSIGADGVITGSFSNGLSRNLGQIAIASFSNPMGLSDVGGNLYETGSNSGLPVISTPLSRGAGAIRGGSLELSNVDLSNEFINLIIASSGFSAASRVISTSDQLITELLNSTR